MSTLPASSSQPPKPVSQIWRPDLTKMPALTPGRRLFRLFFRSLCKAIVYLCTRVTITGVENYPRQGPALLVINHLGDPDIILTLAALPDFPEILGKIELLEVPVLGTLCNMLGVIWVHRGQPDRRAVSAILEAFHQGRRVLIAPEGQESVSGALEAGTDGAAFLAIKSGVPLVPITVTGSEFRQIEKGLKNIRRTRVSVTIGKSFELPLPAPDENTGHTQRRGDLRGATQLIMETLARQLPPEYRGVYAFVDEAKGQTSDHKNSN